jgi:uncharacterized protein YbjT (DUF2867 family)
MRKYVVAGATGRVGSAAASRLLEAGLQPTAIVRSESAQAAWEARGARCAVGSLDDPSFLSVVLTGAAGFFTLLPEDVPPDSFHQRRKGMADSITMAVYASGVPHVVCLSAIPACLTHGNGPASDLRYLENRLRATAAQVTVLRACYFQDNVRDVLYPARESGVYPTFFPSTDAPLPMVAAADVGRFAAEALMHPAGVSEIVDVLGPAYSPRDVAARLAAALGREVTTVPVPAGEHVPSLVRAGVPQPLAEILAEMFSAAAAGGFVPQGDRRLAGSTPIDRVIDDAVRSGPAASV